MQTIFIAEVVSKIKLIFGIDAFYIFRSLFLYSFSLSFSQPSFLLFLPLLCLSFQFLLLGLIVLLVLNNILNLCLCHLNKIKIII